MNPFSSKWLTENEQDILHRLLKRIDSDYRNYQQAVQQCKDEKTELEKSSQYLSNVMDARNIAQKVSETIMVQAHKQIAGVVTHCLQSVFGPDYGFKIRFEKKRGRTEARPILLRRGHEIEDPLHEDSGGVCDVAAFALRLSCLMLIKPKLRRILIMDEPFENVHSETYREKIREMILQLSEKFQMQFVIVPGDSDLMVGKEIHL